MITFEYENRSSSQKSQKETPQLPRGQWMRAFDLINRRGTVVTASDRVRADIGIRNGKIAALSDHFNEPSREIIDADGLLVFPGGVDVHVHLAQPTSDGTIMADDMLFRSVALLCANALLYLSVE